MGLILLTRCLIVLSTGRAISVASILCRPGRMWVEVEVKAARRWRAGAKDRWLTRNPGGSVAPTPSRRITCNNITVNKPIPLLAQIFYRKKHLIFRKKRKKKRWTVSIVGTGINFKSISLVPRTSDRNRPEIFKFLDMRRSVRSNP